MASIIVIMLVLVACLIVLVARKYVRRSTPAVKNTNRSYEAWKRSRKMRLQ